MEFKQKFIDTAGEVYYEQKYFGNKPMFEELRDSNGNYLFDIIGITDYEWHMYIKYGHRQLPNNFNENDCFDAGVNEAIKKGIENAEKQKVSENK